MLTLILGLGNVGKKYQQTRHNLGFEVVDRVVEKLGAVRQEDAALYEWWKVEVGGADGDVRTDREDAVGEDTHRAREDQERSRRPEAGLAMTGSADGGAMASDRGTRSKLWDTEEEKRQAGRPDATKRELILAKPRTYMNGSGEAAKELIERLGITPAEILVVVDDFQIPLGAVRFRQNGSDGGHNGLISVIEELGTQAFPRLRLGVGAPVDKAQVVDYVLSRFTTQEKPTVEKMLAVAAEGVIFAVQHRLEVVMSKYNFNPAPPDLA